MGDELIKKRCQAIYDHHREALNEIFENCHSSSAQGTEDIEK